MSHILTKCLHLETFCANCGRDQTATFKQVVEALKHTETFVRQWTATLPNEPVTQLSAVVEAALTAAQGGEAT